MDFCDRTGVKFDSYTNYERGTRSPDAETIGKIQKATGVNVNWLLTGEGEMLLNSSDHVRSELSATEETLQASAAATLDAKLLGRLSTLCAAEHKKHDIKLAGPALTIATIEIYNNIASRVVDMNDKAAVEAMIPVAIKELGERLKEAEAEPGTGKRLA